MLVEIEKVVKDEKVLLSLTGYTIKEFGRLSVHFRATYEQFIKSELLDSNKARQRQVRKVRKNALLPTHEHRLLFVLYRQKLNPLQTQLGVQFGLNQPQVSRVLGKLEKVLGAALDSYLVENQVEIQTDPTDIADKVNGLEEVIVDVTERPIQRSMDAAQQKADYSGKKKTLRKKSGDY